MKELPHLLLLKTVMIIIFQSPPTHLRTAQTHIIKSCGYRKRLNTLTEALHS